jgi:hypothetical protein
MYVSISAFHPQSSLWIILFSIYINIIYKSVQLQR